MLLILKYYRHIPNDAMLLSKKYVLGGRVVKWEGGRGLNSKFHFLTNFTTTHFNQAQERCYRYCFSFISILVSNWWQNPKHNFVLCIRKSLIHRWDISSNKQKYRKKKLYILLYDTSTMVFTVYTNATIRSSLRFYM